MEKVVKEALERVEIPVLSSSMRLTRLQVHAGIGSGPDVSREGVQPGLLPIVEGSSVLTKHGMVKTDHVSLLRQVRFT